MIRRTVQLAVDDNLGPIGLGFAADELEVGADQLRPHSVMHAESLQFAADLLRQAAAMLAAAGEP